MKNSKDYRVTIEKYGENETIETLIQTCNNVMKDLFEYRNFKKNDPIRHNMSKSQSRILESFARLKVWTEVLVTLFTDKYPNNMEDHIREIERTLTIIRSHSEKDPEDNMCTQ